ncbi:MAG: hypothetical protein WKF30_19070 [Pyrinomonadaceae bacterium]
MDEKKVSLEDRACPLGCAPDDELLFSGRDRLHDLPGIFQVVKCRACGLMRTNPRPTPETIGFYYPENYGPYQSTRVDENRNNHQRSPLKRTLRKLFKRIFQLNIERLPAPPTARDKRLLK